MPLELPNATPNAVPPARPSSEELLAAFGPDYLTVQSLFKFCFVPGGRLNLLRERALGEEWGVDHFVLTKYLAVHVRLAIEQACFFWNDEQIVIAAGSLTTVEGLPIYLGLVPNNTPDENPWVMNWVGERPSTRELPESPALGEWAPFEAGSEVVVACDVTALKSRAPMPGFGGAGAVVQSCAVAGAIQWSLHRGLAVRQLHGDRRGYFVPVFLSSREDLTLAPDWVAPVSVRGAKLVVRALLEPEVAYPSARVCVDRREQLPAWLLDAWRRSALDSPVAGRDEMLESH